RRVQESPYNNLKSLIDDLVPALQPLMDKPFMLFGHSMGGLVAFELARALRERNLNMPAKLFVSSTPGLTTYSKREVDHTVSDLELIDMFPHLSEQNIQDSELRQLLLNLLRADLELINSYSYNSADPLTFPIVAIHGDEDDRVSRSQAEKWKEETIHTCKVI